ncbi:uncharacterized protein [Argopecten irradians]|uniref:uncharacterized protein n=1 Tax=Argopecten irradians TaxID=31199 RepID=UPI0037204240
MPSKCELFKTSVAYLGHIVSEEGISTDPDKTKVVKSWPTPSNIKELRQFLVFVGYYRRFVKDYSKIVQPLNALLKGHGTTKRAKENRHKKVTVPAKWTWGEQQQTAFDTIKEKMVSPPVLGYADYSQPFACGSGLGAVLYQIQQGQKVVISYASRGLRPSEKNYPAHKLEFLALKWAITDKFHDYL